MCSSFTCPREVSRRRRQTRISCYQEAQPRVWPGRSARALEEPGTDLVFAPLGSRTVRSAHTPARCNGGGEPKSHRIRLRAGKGGILSPSLCGLPHAFLPCSCIQPPRARSLPPGSIPSSPRALRTWAHPIRLPGGLWLPRHELRLSPQTRVVAPGCSSGRCCDPLGLALLLPFFWRNHQLPGRRRGEQPFGRLLSADSSARALKQTTGKRRLLRICQPDAAWLSGRLLAAPTPPPLPPSPLPLL